MHKVKGVNKIKFNAWRKYLHSKALIFVGGCAVVGAAVTILSYAATSSIGFEAESGTLTNGATKVVNSSASAGSFAQFSGAATPNTSFQPTAPYHATFYYPWYKNAATDGGYSYWQDAGNTPPNSWFAHYLPDIDPTKFDPTTELYSSNDYATFKWQLSKLAEAKQEVAIASWFGQGTKQDTAIKTYFNDFMKRTDNPYPNLRWALYYECEGIATAGASSCPSSVANPTTAQLISDLTYIKDNMASSPYFLKVNGRPVIFVYGETEGIDTLTRWRDANAQLGNYFYVVQKVFTGYATASPQPDSWHQYGPASNYGSHGTYSAYVSPGFWKDVSDPVDGAVRLGRDLTRFQNDVTRLAAADVTWKLVETWNEWGEGSSVEPGTQTIINSTGKEVADPNGAPFGNSYIQALSDRLPALEQGAGAVASHTNNSTVASLSTNLPWYKAVGRYITTQGSHLARGASRLASAGGRAVRNASSSVINFFTPPTASAQTSSTSFVFSSGGDIGANSSTTASYAKLDKSGSVYFLALGDLDYDETASDEAWCTYTKANLPTLFANPNYPFELVTGNHEEEGGPDGYILNHAACLPDQMASQGTYPMQYYFDYPKTSPLMRTIMISPNLKVGGVTYEYRNGTANATWLSNAIDQARASGIQWVTVGMHKNCLSAGVKPCEISEDLINLLVSKKVDIILQGHEHNYQRTHQLAINGTSCTALSNSSYNANCVVSRTDPNVYGKGAGPMIIIDGIVGRSGTNYPISTSDPSYPYMVKAVANGTDRGFVKWTVTRDRVDAQFVASAGTLTDTFSIVNGTTTPPTTDTTSPTVSLTSPVSGTTVSASTNITATANDNVGVTKVDFYIDGTIAGSDSSSPYQLAWDTTKVTNGSHQIQARAYDAANNTSSSSIATVTVSNGCQNVPASTHGKIDSTINADAGLYNVWVRMMATDTTNNSVGLSVGTACPITVGDNASLSTTQWTWVNYANGNTSNIAQITLPNNGTQSISLYGREAGVKVDRVLLIAGSCSPTGNGDNCVSTPDTTPPTVTISAPANGTTVSAQSVINATATDASGISKVEFYVDGTLIAIDTGSPYETSFNTTTLANGSHSLQAKAFDTAGNTGTSATVTIMVANNTGSTIVGDLDGNNIVNIFDVSILVSRWGTNDPKADLDKNGIVNILDISLLASNWTR
jgi:Bacterial Ig domain/Calcineurin-like phosphoesterase